MNPRALALAIVVATSSAHAGPAEIAAAVAGDALSQGPTPGVSIAIVQHGRVVFAGGFGKAELDNDIAASEQSVFRINSITKAFTAIVIWQLVEAGKLRLDDHLSKYLPDYARDHDPTLAQLLDHTSGLASYHGELFDHGIKLDLTARQWVDLLAKQRLYLTEPGKAWSYSNAAYDLLGLVAEQVGGEPLADLFAHRVFAPAGLVQTALCDRRAVVPHRATSYAWHGDHFEHVASWGTYGEASDGLCSSVLDLARFVQAIDTGKLVSAKSLAHMRTGGVLAGGQSYDYGSGTRLGHLGGARVVAFTGSGEDWSSAIFEVPDKELAVIALANADSMTWSATRIAGEIARRVLALPDRALDLDVPAALGNKLRGRWQSAGDPPAIITYDGHHIVVQPEGAPQPLRLAYQGASSFRLADLEFVFDLRRAPSIAAAQYRAGVFTQLMLLEPAH